jgi:hypothetical protein
MDGPISCCPIKIFNMNLSIRHGYTAGSTFLPMEQLGDSQTFADNSSIYYYIIASCPISANPLLKPMPMK